jgi:hypothetical protein
MENKDFELLWEKSSRLIKSFLRRKFRPEEMQDALQLARIIAFEASKKFDINRFNFNNRGEIESFASFCCLLISRKMWREIIKFRYPFSVPAYLLEDPAHPYRSFLEREKILDIEDDITGESELPDENGKTPEEIVVNKMIVDDIIKTARDLGYDLDVEDLLLVLKEKRSLAYLIRERLKEKGY